MAGALDKVLHPSDQVRVLDAIKLAERATSVEIKVHVEGRCPGGDAGKRALDLFKALAVNRTKRRNGVLIYVAVRERRFAIQGDTGIHERADSSYWPDAVQRMTFAFGRGAFGEGIVGAIQAVARRLAPRFPHSPDDQNEVDNDITTDESAI
ncbi:MAG TPA: TPM domain-containing protein [Polyangia bacterium]|nr:TPM domain-containing protein [Polyangia bacterium]